RVPSASWGSVPSEAPRLRSRSLAGAPRRQGPALLHAVLRRRLFARHPGGAGHTDRAPGRPRARPHPSLSRPHGPLGVAGHLRRQARLQPQPTHQARRLLSPERRAQSPEPESARLQLRERPARAPPEVARPDPSGSEPAGATDLPRLRSPGGRLLRLAPRRDRLGADTPFHRTKPGRRGGPVRWAARGTVPRPAQAMAPATGA